MADTDSPNHTCEHERYTEQAKSKRKLTREEVVEKPYEHEKSEGHQDDFYPLQKDRLGIPDDMPLTYRGASYTET